MCKHCNIKLSYKNKNNTFCSRSCSAKFNNKFRKVDKKLKCFHCNKNLNGLQKKFCSKKCFGLYKREENFKKNANGEGTHPKTIRLYMIKVFGYQCQQCKNTKWRNQPIPLDLDHIDGNSYNNNIDNLRLLCLNCHGLTPTYKFKNKGRGRHKRKQRYKQGKSY